VLISAFADVIRTVLQPFLSKPEFAGVTRTSFKSALGQPSQSLDNQDTFMPKSRDKHQVAALGGTFDHLHGGHKILLTMAACITAKRLIVGLTSEFAG
jgi:bifunctional ADP-heptose synthase (sugar kinase/adenylyltransferase)